MPDRFCDIANMAVITKMGKEAIDAVAAVMHRMRQVSRLKETHYLGDIKMWDIGEPDETSTNANGG